MSGNNKLENINQSQLLYYGSLVTQLPNIILSLDMVSDDISELENIQPQTKVMLELALTNLSKINTEHTKFFNELEDIYKIQQQKTHHKARESNTKRLTETNQQSLLTTN